MAAVSPSVSPSVVDILGALDDEQKQAVVHVSGPALVLAGPGAGKTRTLTHHAALLVAIGIPADSILVCTFTKKATQEMEERLAELIGAETGRLFLGTIHATCYRLLREYWRQRGEKVREVASESLLRTIANMLLDRAWAKNDIGMDLGSRGVTARDLLRFFSAARDRLLPPDAVPPDQVPALVGPRWEEIRFQQGRRAPTPEEWVEAYRRFQQVKADRGMLDFDDMAPLLWETWQRDPGLLAAHQSRFQHVLIDEFQDTSYGQWELLRTISQPQNNVFAVGDVDQSMYSFRFARPEFALKFQNYYNDTAKIYYVQTNYRSRPQIVTLANVLISHNRERLPLTLRPYRGTLDDATSAVVSMLEPEDDADEAESVAAEIEERYAGRWQDVAVLYRCNWYSAKVELALLRHQVPYRVVGGLSFFEHKPVLDLLAYLRLAEDPTDADSFARAVQAPSRYLGREFLRTVQAHAGLGGDLVAAATRADLPPRQAQAAREFASLVQSLPQSPAEAVRRVREQTGYDAWFLQRGADEEDDEHQSGRLGILDELEHVASAYSTRAELLAYVDAVLESGRDEGGSRVTLSTIHRAKGLEWPVVYVLGFVDGLLPHARAYGIGMAGIEEERRIAYVAMTRAKDRLVLSRPLYVGEKPTDPSPFLVEAGVR